MTGNNIKSFYYKIFLSLCAPIDFLNTARYPIMLKFWAYLIAVQYTQNCNKFRGAAAPRLRIRS